MQYTIHVICIKNSTHTFIIKFGLSGAIQQTKTNKTYRFFKPVLQFLTNRHKLPHK